MSNVTMLPASPRRPDRTPRSMSRASSSPLTTSMRRPVARSTAVTNARPFAASRTALVATTRTRSAAKRSARATYSLTTATVRAMGDSPSVPAVASPSPSRVTVWCCSTTCQLVAPTTSATRSRTVLLPTSIVETRMPRNERPAGSRRGVSEVGAGELTSP